MARPKSSTPSYRHHRASGQAVVTIGGKEVYLGPWKSAASRGEYDRVVGEWLARGRIAAPNPSAGITVTELLADYLRWAKGTGTSWASWATNRSIVCWPNDTAATTSLCG